MDNITGSLPVINVPPKNIDRISNELFTSLFVLSSEFSFKPVTGKSYWLYRKNNIFRLSLISPDEWKGREFGQFIGECILQKDITWSLHLDEKAAEDQGLHRLIEKKRLHLLEKIETAEKVETIFPVFEESFSFYRRVLASALSRSLGISMKKSGIYGLSYKEIELDST